MDPKILKQITAQIYQRYPDFSNCPPKVRQQTMGNQSNGGSTYLLTFQKTGQVNTPSGLRKIPQTLRVVVSSAGKILKVSSSR